LPDIGEGFVLSELRAADIKKIEKAQAGNCINDSIHIFLQVDKSHAWSCKLAIPAYHPDTK
jgi:hypothetical protein